MRFDSRHPWDEDVGCLRCVSRHAAGRPAEIVARDATGLSVDRINDPQEAVTENDVQALLHPRVGIWPAVSVVPFAQSFKMRFVSRPSLRRVGSRPLFLSSPP